MSLRRVGALIGMTAGIGWLVGEAVVVGIFALVSRAEDLAEQTSPDGRDLGRLSKFTPARPGASK